MATNITVGRLLGSTEASVTVANTTTQTLLATGIDIPANTLNDGAFMDGVACGQYSVAAATTPTLTWIVRITAVDALSSGAQTAGSGVSNQAWALHYWGTIRTLGATGTLMLALNIFSQDFANQHRADITADTINTTALVTMDVTMTWSAAAAGNTITMSQHSLLLYG